MKQTRRFLPIIGLALCAFIWGYNWVVMKTALADAGPFQFGAIRALGGGAVLFGVVIVLRRPLGPGSFWGVLLLGLLQTTAFFGLSIWALVSGGAGKTAALIYTMPMWILLLSWPLLGERLERWQWPAVFSALIGLFFLVHPWEYQSHLFSTFLAILAGFAWALSGVWSKYLRQKIKVDLLALNAWQLVLGGIPLFFIAVRCDTASIVFTPYFITAVIYNVVLATALAWSLWFFALQELSAGMAGMGTLLTPVIGVLAAWLQLKEVPTTDEAIGMALILSGLAILSVAGGRSGKG